VEWFIFWLIINAVVGFLIGQQKNDVATAIVLSILLGPIGWLIAALSSGNLPKCPHCAEFVKPEATVCRHCGKDLPEMIRQIPEAPAPEPPLPKASKGEKIALAAVLSVIVIASMAVVLYSGEKKKPQSGIETTPTTQAQAATKAETPQETYFSLKLTRPVELKDSVGHVVARLQQGQSVQYVGRDNYLVRIRYDGADYDIRISSTDLK